MLTLEPALHHLAAEDVIAVASETVYGLAADGYSSAAIEKIYQIKQRPPENPLILHYAYREQVVQDVQWNPYAEQLAQLFWPGPLTLVLERTLSCQVPAVASAGRTSLAVRIPAHPLFRRLLKAYGRPLAAPSANPSGKLSPTKAQHVTDFFQGRVPVLEGGSCQYGLESTILDCRALPLKLLRPGSISLERLKQATGFEIQGPSSELIAPGMLSSHYCPSKPLRLNVRSVEAEEGLLAFGPPLLGSCMTVQLSLKEDLEEAACCFFDALYCLDQSSCQRIAVMPIPQQGIGLALNDRLKRAAYTG